MKNNSMRVLIFELIIVVVGFSLLSTIYNSCTADEWNNGICPKCHVRYELRGETRYHKTYVCPECGNEVIRY